MTTIDGPTMLRRMGVPPAHSAMASNVADGGAFDPIRNSLSDYAKEATATWARSWDFKEIRPKNWSCTLVGPRGTGKTTLALRMTARRAIKQAQTHGDFMVCRAGFWISGAVLAGLVDAGRDYGSSKRQELHAYVDRAKRARFLVFDDVSAIAAAGTSQLVAAAYGKAAEIFQERYLERWTLVTTAVSLEDLSEAMPTAADRLAEALVVNTAPRNQRLT